MTLKEAGISLLDCLHKTPTALESGYPYIAIPQMKNGQIEVDEARRISKADFLEWTQKAKPIVHDVIVSRRCNPGVTAHVPAGLECAVGQNLILLRSNGDLVFPPFLRWLLRGPEWWDQVRTFLNVGAVFDSLRCADIPEFSLLIPPINQQCAIAYILGALDDKIELNRQMNATLEGMARAIFKSWFVDFDPVRARMDGRQPYGMDEATAALFPESFVHVHGELIPQGWQIGPLSSLAKIVMGTSPKSTTYNESGDGTPLVNGPVEFGDYFPVKKKWTTAPTRFSQKHDLIFCVRGSTTGRRIVSDGEYCVGRGVCAIRANPGQQEFVNRLIDCELDRMLQRATGSVFPSLSGPQMKEFDILKPASAVVNKYCEIVQPSRQRVEVNVRESQTLAALRDTLLPKLLSGELRVSDAEKMIERVL